MVQLHDTLRQRRELQREIQRRDERQAANMAANLSGFKAFGHVKRQIVKDDLEDERRSAAYQKVEEQADEIGADTKTRRAMRLRVAHGSRLFDGGICEWNALVKQEVANRWANMPENEKTEWLAFARVAAARGQVRAEEVRVLFAREPQLIATN